MSDLNLNENERDKRLIGVGIPEEEIEKLKAIEKFLYKRKLKKSPKSEEFGEFHDFGFVNLRNSKVLPRSFMDVSEAKSRKRTASKNWGSKGKAKLAEAALFKGKFKSRLYAHKHSISGLSVSFNNDLLVSFIKDGEIKIWDYSRMFNNLEFHALCTINLVQGILSVAFCSVDNMIAVSSINSQLHFLKYLII